MSHCRQVLLAKLVTQTYRDVVPQNCLLNSHREKRQTNKKNPTANSSFASRINYDAKVDIVLLATWKEASIKIKATRYS